MYLAQQTRYFRYRFVLHQLGCRHSGHATVSPATSEDVISTDADHVCRCRSSSTQTKNRHFDRSCSRFCEQRSGEIRFSTTTRSRPTPRSCLCCHPTGLYCCSACCLPRQAGKNRTISARLKDHPRCAKASKKREGYATEFKIPRIWPKKSMSSPKTI